MSLFFEKFDPDSWAPRLLDSLSPWLNVNGPCAKEEFSSHFFSNATIVLFFLSFGKWWSIFPALLPLVLTLWQELLRDGHWIDLFKKTDSGRDGRADLLSRGLGATLPFIVLIWR